MTCAQAVSDRERHSLGMRQVMQRALRLHLWSFCRTIIRDVMLIKRIEYRTLRTRLYNMNTR